MYNIVQIVQEVQETLEFAAGKNHLRKRFLEELVVSQLCLYPT
jgi:hypothetical protein